MHILRALSKNVPCIMIGFATVTMEIINVRSSSLTRLGKLEKEEKWEREGLQE